MSYNFSRFNLTKSLIAAANEILDEKHHHYPKKHKRGNPLMKIKKYEQYSEDVDLNEAKKSFDLFGHFKRRGFFDVQKRGEVYYTKFPEHVKDEFIELHHRGLVKRIPEVREIKSREPLDEFADTGGYGSPIHRVFRYYDKTFIGSFGHGAEQQAHRTARKLSKSQPHAVLTVDKGKETITVYAKSWKHGNKVAQIYKGPNNFS